MKPTVPFRGDLNLIATTPAVAYLFIVRGEERLGGVGSLLSASWDPGLISVEGAYLLLHDGEGVRGHHGRHEEHPRAPVRYDAAGKDVGKDDSPAPECSVKSRRRRTGVKFVIKNAGGDNTVVFQLKVAE